MAGLTSTGFEAATLEEIKASIEEDERALISPTLNTSSASVVGQLNGIFASKLREAWELIQAVYNAYFDVSASGYALTLRAALTGTTRRAATYSTVTATVNVDPGTYAAGTLIASVQDSPTSRFVNTAAVVNGGGTAANVDALFTCESTGPVRANAGTLTVIAQAVSGWNSVTNADDATLGQEEESDAELRLRRIAELSAQGSTNADAIRADLLRDVTGVLSVKVLENDTNAIDANSVPPHSVECIVYGPVSPSAADNQLVADTIWSSKAAGTGTSGTTTKTVTDSQGIDHNVSFTRPTALPVYCEIDIDVDDTYGGDTAVKEALVAAADGLEPGDPLYWSKVIGLVYAVPGVVLVTSFGLSTSGGGPFTQTNISPTVRQVVTFGTGDITVTTTVV